VISTEAKELLEKIFEINPENRLSLEKIKQSKWF